MKLFLLTGLIFGIYFSANSQHANPTTEVEKLKKVLLDYFEGIKNRDTNKMIEVTTQDFVAYEEGKVYNNDSVFRDMKKLPYISANFKFDNFKVNVDKLLGTMYYSENAVFVINDSTKYDLNFLGSAAFVKKDGSWKMNFLHSTKKYFKKNKK